MSTESYLCQVSFVYWLGRVGNENRNEENWVSLENSVPWIPRCECASFAPWSDPSPTLRRLILLEDSVAFFFWGRDLNCPFKLLHPTPWPLQTCNQGMLSCQLWSQIGEEAFTQICFFFFLSVESWGRHVQTDFEVAWQRKKKQTFRCDSIYWYGNIYQKFWIQWASLSRCVWF